MVKDCVMKDAHNGATMITASRCSIALMTGLSVGHYMILVLLKSNHYLLFKMRLLLQHGNVSILKVNIVT